MTFDCEIQAGCMRRACCYGNEGSEGINFCRHFEMPTAMSEDTSREAESENNVKGRGRKKTVPVLQLEKG